jgi:hypothetical protein
MMTFSFPILSTENPGCQIGVADAEKVSTPQLIFLLAFSPSVRQ